MVVEYVKSRILNFDSKLIVRGVADEREASVHDYFDIVELAVSFASLALLSITV